MASVPGGGVERHGFQGRSKFRNLCRIFDVSNAYKKEEQWRFFKDALWGGGRVPPGAGLAWWMGGWVLVLAGVCKLDGLFHNRSGKVSGASVPGG